MEEALNVHRLHFAFTITFHYIFPQLTMGLALLLVYLKTKALRTNDEHYNRAARFWARIFGINFAVGVVTGVPMEFQFGTNWAAFSRAAGGVIGQTLAMEGVFSFFLESSFLGLFLFGEKRLGRVGHWWAGFLVWLGSWLSGYFIVATNAWMQYPTGHRVDSHGQIELASFWSLLVNKWVFWQYAHTMLGAVQTGCFVMAAVGAFYLLTKRHDPYGNTFVKSGVLVGAVAALLQLFPTGDAQGKLIADHQPVTLAAMEGLFETQSGAPLVIIGQPDVQKAPPRQSDSSSQHAELFNLPPVDRAGSRPRRIFSGPVAGHYRASVLQLSRDGGTRHNFHCRDGLGSVAVVAGKALRLQCDAVGAHAMRSASVHCQYRRMDDRRIGASAVAHLRADAYRSRSVAEGGRRQCMVYADRIHGLVCGAGHPVALSRLPRN